MNKPLIMLVALAIPLIALNASWSQEEEPKYEFTFGTVVSKIENQITVSEYNIDTGEEENVVYNVNEETNFENQEGLADLDVGDEIEVLYVVEGDQRIVASVAESEEDEIKDDSGDAGGEENIGGNEEGSDEVGGQGQDQEDDTEKESL